MKSKFVCAVFCLAVFLGGIFICPARAQAYENVGTGGDYLLRTEKPENRSAGHYFEFVNPDQQSYTVQEGDTLWGIARKYYGSGEAYEKLWEDNRELIDAPECMQVGVRLKLSPYLYIGAGMQDAVPDDGICGFRYTTPAWHWKPNGHPYQMFQTATYRNDFGKDDPYRHWEAFQREAEECGRRICGDRVSDLSFARYRVTDLCDLCYYQFVFDGGGKKYLIMTAFVYTDEARSDGYENLKTETFTVCDLDRCSEAELREAKGRTFYMAARYMDTGQYFAKTEDYVGAEDWPYPQLHNPFTQAMRSLYDGPLERVEEYPDDHEIVWKDPTLEKLVREELIRLWQLTDGEKKAFMERPVTRADLAGIDSLYLRIDQRYEEYQSVALQLNGYSQSRGFKGPDRDKEASAYPAVLTGLEDLENFTRLSRLDLNLYWSDFTDFSPIGRLTGLRELSIYMEDVQSRIENADIAFLGNLTNLRLLELYGLDKIWISYEPTLSLEKITDLSVLVNCPRLKYLHLTTGNVENYDFLGELPEMYSVVLEGERHMKNVAPDRSLLPNAGYISCNHEIIYWELEQRRRR